MSHNGQVRWALLSAWLATSAAVDADIVQCLHRRRAWAWGEGNEREGRKGGVGSILKI